MTMPLDRREALVALADKYGIPIIEDDPYGQLRYEGEHLPPLVQLDRATKGIQSDNGYNLGNVIYLSTFSKTLAPGLRLGWIIAPAEVIAKLVQLKQGADLHTGTFVQMVAFEVARGGFLDEHIHKIREVYRARRDVMLAALEAEFPTEVTWTHPAGGLFLWVRLPAGMNSHTLLESALAQNVAFVPGDAFYTPDAPTKEALRHLRLNFSNMKPEQIKEGIHRLATAYRALQAGGKVEEFEVGYASA
jgi:2-aminoadipate transaminase